MRVRMLKTVQSYWNYSVQRFEKGDELDGDLARHLADNAPDKSVEVLEDDRPSAAPPVVEPSAGPVGSGELDIEAKAADVLTWVDDDPERATEALAAESAKEAPRSTLVKALEKLAADDTPQG
jgi:hypothetical protein